MFLLSAFGGGLFLIPVGLLILSLILGLVAYKKFKSGGGHEGLAVFAVFLLIGAIGSSIWMYLER